MIYHDISTINLFGGLRPASQRALVVRLSRSWQFNAWPALAGAIYDCFMGISWGFHGFNWDFLWILMGCHGNWPRVIKRGLLEIHYVVRWCSMILPAITLNLQLGNFPTSHEYRRGSTKKQTKLSRPSGGPQCVVDLHPYVLNVS